MVLRFRRRRGRFRKKRMARWIKNHMKAKPGKIIHENKLLTASSGMSRSIKVQAWSGENLYNAGIPYGGFCFNILHNTKHDNASTVLYDTDAIDRRAGPEMTATTSENLTQDVNKPQNVKGSGVKQDQTAVVDANHDAISEKVSRRNTRIRLLKSNMVFEIIKTNPNSVADPVTPGDLERSVHGEIIVVYRGAKHLKAHSEAILRDGGTVGQARHNHCIREVPDSAIIASAVGANVMQGQYNSDSLKYKKSILNNDVSIGTPYYIDKKMVAVKRRIKWRIGPGMTYTIVKVPIKWGKWGLSMTYNTEVTTYTGAMQAQTLDTTWDRRAMQHYPGVYFTQYGNNKGLVGVNEGEPSINYITEVSVSQKHIFKDVTFE